MISSVAVEPATHQLPTIKTNIYVIDDAMTTSCCMTHMAGAYTRDIAKPCSDVVPHPVPSTFYTSKKYSQGKEITCFFFPSDEYTPLLQVQHFAERICGCEVWAAYIRDVDGDDGQRQTLGPASISAAAGFPSSNCDVQCHLSVWDGLYRLQSRYCQKSVTRSMSKYDLTQETTRRWEERFRRRRLHARPRDAGVALT